MLRILDITAPDMNNGTGMRVTLWCAGCNHRCKGCHNKWTWKYEQGESYHYYCKDIFKKLDYWLSKPYISGLTISGGDPLAQDNDGLCELNNIVVWAKETYPTKDIWLYTGYTKEEIDDASNFMLHEVLKSVDVLVDGPYIEEKRDVSHCPFRGSTNQRIIYLNKKPNEDS